MASLQRVLYICFLSTLYTYSPGAAQDDPYAQNPYLQSGLAGGAALGPFASLLGPQPRQGFSSPSAPGQFGAPAAFAPQPLAPQPQDLPVSNVPCPERNSRYPLSQQCDAYVECQDGIGKEKLCPEGLLFNAKAPLGSYPCQYPVEVDCEGRNGRQPANPTDQCPHQFGLYKMGNENQCGQYLNCANGAGFVTDCPEGLAFNEASLQCDWPDQVANCHAEGFLGFTCPLTGNSVYDYEAVRYYKHPSDCQKYFHCVKGRPRLYSCGGGQAFNEFISSCDGTENVTGCGGPPRRPIGSALLSKKIGSSFNQPGSDFNQAFGGNSPLAPDFNQRSPNFNQLGSGGFSQTQSPFNQQGGFGQSPNSPDYTLPPYIQPPPPPSNLRQNQQSGFGRPTSGAFGGNNRSPFNQRGGGGFNAPPNFGQQNGFNRGSRNFSPSNSGPFGGFRTSNPLTRRQLPFDSPNVRYARRN